MRMIDQWTDDHLPCCSFEHEGKLFSISWTGETIIGRLEMVEEGDVSFEQALKKYKGLLAIIQNPLDAKFNSTDEGEPEDKEYWEEGCAQYMTDVGFVEVEPFNG